MKRLSLAVLFLTGISIGYAQSPGTKRWTFTTGAKITASPAIADDGTIYVGSQDKKLYAVNPSGSKAWEFTASGAIQIAPSIGPDGTIYIAAADNTLYAVGSDGNKRWEFPTSFSLIEPLAIGSDGTIYFSSPTGNLIALNANGSEKWRFKTGSSVPAPSVASDGTIYIASTTYLGAQTFSLYALSPDSSIKWRYDIGRLEPRIGSPVEIDTDGTIYFMRSANLTALRPDGTKKFDGVSFDAKFSIGAGGILYGRSQQNGFIDAFSATGTIKWHAKLPSTPFVVIPSTYSAIADDGTVYVGSEGGILYALDSSGNVKWGFETGSSLHSPPTIGTDGTVYFGADDGKLYAISGSAGPAKSAWPMYRRDAKHTGAVSSSILSQTELGLSMYPGITIKGNVAISYRIEFSTDTGDAKNWQFLASVTLDRTPFFFVDVNAGNSTKRFYRAVLSP